MNRFKQSISETKGSICRTYKKSLSVAQHTVVNNILHILKVLSVTTKNVSARRKNVEATKDQIELERAFHIVHPKSGHHVQHCPLVFSPCKLSRPGKRLQKQSLGWE